MSIHKKRRKVEICHNCHTILSLENNFCPQCGQENHDLKVPIGHLAFEVFEGFTHFDTKFYNTMSAIFTSPGKITKDFLEGRRGRYVAPIRLYFLISFIFFLGLSSMIDLALNKSDSFLNDFIAGATSSSSNEERVLRIAKKELKSIENASDTIGLFKAKNKVKLAEITLKKYQDKIDNIAKTEKTTNKWVKLSSDVDVGEVLDEMNIQENDTLRKIITFLPAEKQRQRLINIQKQIIADTINSEPIKDINYEMRGYFTEVIGQKRQLAYSLNPHALKNNVSVRINYGSDTIITVKGSDGSLPNTVHFKKVLAMNNDSLDKVSEKNGINIFGINFFNRGFLKNLTYYQLAFNEDAKKASSELAHLFVNILSVMMFVLMPIVAFLLKIIYSKRSHSIFSYPFRLFMYLWDWLMYLVAFRKSRKYKTVPHLSVGDTRYYYEHLIFSIHIHAVLFLFLIIFVGGGIALGFWKYALIATFLVFIVYSIIALKVVYRQGILKTLFKSAILFILYFISFITVLSITSAIKFALS